MGTNREFITQEMINWAMENQCVITEGECGFGRDCVGLSRGGQWVSWRAHRMSEPYGVLGTPWAGDVPRKSYHKSDVVAVLGRDDSAWENLGIWLQDIIDEGWTVGQESNGATGLQVVFSGVATPLLVPPSEVTE